VLKIVEDQQQALDPQEIEQASRSKPSNAVGKTERVGHGER
jgi:hypothetical protein